MSLHVPRELPCSNDPLLGWMLLIWNITFALVLWPDCSNSVITAVLLETLLLVLYQFIQPSSTREKRSPGINYSWSSTEALQHCHTRQNIRVYSENYETSWLCRNSCFIGQFCTICKECFEIWCSYVFFIAVRKRRTLIMFIIPLMREPSLDWEDRLQLSYKSAEYKNLCLQFSMEIVSLTCWSR